MRKMRISPITSKISFMTNAKDNSHKKVVKTKEKVSHETKMEEVQKR